MRPILIHQVRYHELKDTSFAWLYLGNLVSLSPSSASGSAVFYWFCERWGSIHSQKLNCQINLKSEPHTSQTALFRFLLTHLWTLVILEMLPVHSEKSNPRCIASPACGPAIISTSAHIVCWVSGDKGHIKTTNKQDFQLNRCPLCVKKNN